MSIPTGGDGFDNLLEQALQRHLGSIQGPSTSAGQAAFQTAITQGANVGLLSTLTSTAAGKAVVGLAATAVVGAGAATAVSGSPNPANWGATVTQAVANCKTEMAASGTHGIGQCVSEIAKQHGAAEKALHASAGRGDHGAAGKAKASEARSDHPGGKPSTKPSPAGGNGGTHGAPSSNPGNGHKP